LDTISYLSVEANSPGEQCQLTQNSIVPRNIIKTKQLYIK